MEALQIIEMLLLLMGAAVLACWLAYSSTIVQEFKALIGLDDRERKPIKWRWFVKPLVFIWTELRELANCPFCMSFWLGLFIAIHYYQDWRAVFIAPITLIFVEIYRKLSL